MTILRSALFNLAFYGLLIGMGTLCLPLLLLPRGWAVAVVRLWARLILALARHVLGLDFRIAGALPPPGGRVVIAAKHQSAWDTIVFLALLDDPAYVLKRELTRLPIYGWFCRKLGMIAVDRAAGAAALRGLVAAAEPVLAAGRPVVIFPQGTRVAPGARRPYLPGVYAIYARGDVTVIPVALDSGRYWGRRAFRKHAGTIALAVLPAMPPGLDRRGFMAELERRIESAALGAT